MNIYVMKNLVHTLQDLRRNKKLKVKDVVALTGIDQALISKFESGRRLPTADQLVSLAHAYETSHKELKTLWLSEKVLQIVEEESLGLEALQVAESRMEYLTGAKVTQLDDVHPKVKQLLLEIDSLHEQWNERKPLNKTQLKKMNEFFHIEYTYESNRIEGNTLSLHETELVVNQGLTIQGKSMVEHLEAINHQAAVDYLMDIASNSISFSKRVVMQLHQLVLQSIDQHNAGRYRTVPVRISGSRHIPPQPYMLDKLIEDYFLFYNKQVKILHPVLLAAEMHERLVSIHPFIDGNGRTARLVMNLILLQNGYTIANIKGSNRSRLKYYNSLEAVRRDNEVEYFHILVGEVVKRSLKAHLKLCG